MIFPAFYMHIVPKAMRRISTNPEICEMEVVYRVVGAADMKFIYRRTNNRWAYHPSNEEVGKPEHSWLEAAYREFARKQPHLSVVPA